MLQQFNDYSATLSLSYIFLTNPLVLTSENIHEKNT